MAELFPESGDLSNSAIAASPMLVGDFIARVDMDEMNSGLGLFIPWGGGSTARRYIDYGTVAEEGDINGALQNLTIDIGGGGVINYNFEGLIGPAGPPGMPGATGPSGFFTGDGWVGANQGLDSVIPNHSIVFTDNDPSAGYISWASGTLRWMGANYSIAAGNSNKKYIYWDSGGSTGIFQGTDAIGDITSGKFVQAHNVSGTAMVVIPGRLMEGELLRNETVKAAAIAADAIETAKLANDAVTAAKIAVAGLDGTTGRIVVGDVVDANVITAAVNSYATTKVEAEKVLISGLVALSDWRHTADNTAIDGAHLYAASVTAAKVLISGATTLSDWRSSSDYTYIDGGKLYADSVTATQINVVGLDGTTGRIVVTDATDANAVTSGINSYAVTLINAGKVLISGSTALSDWSSGSDATYIDGGKIYANSVTATQVAANTITANEIAANTITASELAADSVTAPAINVVGLDGTTGRIVVADATDANAVTSGVNSYATTLIGAGKVLISGSTVLSDWSSGVDATYIDGGNIYTGTITANSIATETLTATQIHADAITTDKLLALNVTYGKLAEDATATITTVADDTQTAATGAWTAYVSDTHSALGGKTEVWATLDYSAAASPTGNCNFQARISLNSVVLDTFTVVQGNGNSNSTTLEGTLVLPAGDYTLELEIYSTDTTPTPYIEGCTVTAYEVRI